MSPRRSRFRTRLLRVLLALIMLTVVAVIGVWYALDRPLPISEETLVHIPRRSSIVAAIDSVDRKVDLSTPWLVKLAARITSRLSGKGLQSGWYTFGSGDTQLDVLRTLFTGDRRNTVRVTLPEGLTYREMARVLARSVDIDTARFVAWCEDDSVTSIYAPGAPSMEGYLMPETYEFFWRDDADVIGTRLAEEFRHRNKDDMPSRDEVILASIVQAEAANVSEMPRIAGVYVNRLQRGMKLEADPTVQYGLGIKDRVLYRHLNDRHAYNTYQHAGLPPGPINNPGTAAIKAARAPERHNYLFFVARGDGSGTHVFASNGADHVKNVAAYRKRRARR